MANNEICSKCKRKLKSVKTGIKVPSEPYRPDDIYDGSYTEVSFKFCPNCDCKKK